MLNPKDIEAVAEFQQSELTQSMVSDHRFHETFDTTVEAVKRNVLKDNGLVMMFLVHARDVDRNDEWAFMPLVFPEWPPPDFVDKHEVMERVGRRFKREFPDFHVRMLFHVSEAWMSHHANDDYRSHTADFPAPSEDPNRVEIVVVYGTTLDQRRSQAVFEMLRDEHGNVVRLEPAGELRYDPKTPENIDKVKDFLADAFIAGYLGMSDISDITDID